MIRMADVAAFLHAQGVDPAVEMVYDGTPLKGSGTGVLLTPTGGAGTTHERLFDRATVQVNIAGPQRDPAGAEQLATDVDHALMDPTPPMQIGGRPVVRIDYLGGPPALLNRDTAGRSHLVCTYVIEIARD